MIILFFGHVLP